ncbi:hypothetical protein BOTNAR_0169g00100 [Botryotinia narcissicola]|uniref:Uncharacterized protein n=1 Tax=Botryotinia narcissicola TaxID=278944 RepID=A0A4Z1IQN6_9HELO|nr:hypothetical protein BOTNAR_0169g00100 [Botryotinia narcissicola]
MPRARGKRLVGARFHWFKAQSKDDELLHLHLFGASILFVALMMLKSLRFFEYQTLSNLHYIPVSREFKEVLKSQPQPVNIYRTKNRANFI